MLCPVCHHETVPLFTSRVCDWCDGTGSFELHRGYVVWPGHEDGRGLYVFRSERDARAWRHARSAHRLPIHEVVSEEPFRWRKTTGRLKDVELADHLFEVYPSRFFPRGEYRAFLVEAPLEATG